MIDNKTVASDLEALLSGALRAGEFSRKYHSQLTSPALDEAMWANLRHYLDDDDIRANDGVYRAMQDGELRKLVQLLRHDAPMEQLGRINFLRPA